MRLIPQKAQNAFKAVQPVRTSAQQIWVCEQEAFEGVQAQKLAQWYFDGQVPIWQERSVEQWCKPHQVSCGGFLGKRSFCYCLVIAFIRSDMLFICFLLSFCSRGWWFYRPFQCLCSGSSFLCGFKLLLSFFGILWVDSLGLWHWKIYLINRKTAKIIYLKTSWLTYKLFKNYPYSKLFTIEII